jgi:hypothetical protein
MARQPCVLAAIWVAREQGWLLRRDITHLVELQTPKGGSGGCRGLHGSEARAFSNRSSVLGSHGRPVVAGREGVHAWMAGRLQVARWARQRRRCATPRLPPLRRRCGQGPAATPGKSVC